MTPATLSRTVLEVWALGYHRDFSVASLRYTVGHTILADFPYLLVQIDRLDVRPRHTGSVTIASANGMSHLA